MKKLKKYQKRAVKAQLQNPYYALFVGMGLGKTRSVLEALRRLKLTPDQKVLIVGPIHVVESTWPDEIAKWKFDFTYSLMRGRPVDRLAALSTDADIYGINFESLPWLADQKKLLKKFKILVIDELTRAKSTGSFAYRFFKYKRPQFERIIGLTGIITPESYVDLYGQMTSIVKIWDKKTDFLDKYFIDESKNPKYSKWKLKNKKAKKKIEKQIAPYVLTLDSEDYLDVPPFVYNDIWLDMPKKQRARYNELERDFFLELEGGEEVVTATVSATRMKLRQVLSGFIYTEDKRVLTFDSHKLKMASSILDDIDDNVLILYQLKEELRQIQEKFKAIKLSGPGEIDRWNRKKIPLIVGHPKSMGHGLNLQNGGSTVFWYSLPFSMEQYHQANARLRRMGQQEHVLIIRLLYRDTIDEALVDAQSKKLGTHKGLIKSLKAYHRGGS